MPKVSYTLVDGTDRAVDASIGESIMEAAVKHGVPGIVADCGGALACATCHVYVDPAFASAAGEPDSFESDLLEGTASERRDNSRLSCQIEMTDALDGIVVVVPPEQI